MEKTACWKCSNYNNNSGCCRTLKQKCKKDFIAGIEYIIEEDCKIKNKGNCKDYKRGETFTSYDYYKKLDDKKYSICRKCVNHWHNCVDDKCMLSCDDIGFDYIEGINYVIKNPCYIKNKNGKCKDYIRGVK